LKAQGQWSGQDIKPLVTAEFLSALQEFINIEPGELNRPEVFDVEGIVIFVNIIMPDCSLSPYFLNS